MFCPNVGPHVLFLTAKKTLIVQGDYMTVVASLHDQFNLFPTSQGK